MYIFGYGSLMNDASRKLTGHTGLAIPAVAHGLVRHWCKVDDTYKVSPLAVIEGEGQVNGVLLEVDSVALADFDRREAGYKRVAVKAEHIECLDPSNKIPASCDIWIYVVDEAHPPCINVPIVMSYVDTVLAGCLEISDAFAKHFVEHTIGWHYPVKNDRNNPIYQRIAGVKPEHCEKIDQLLALQLSA